ncbi:MAG: DUF2092 domain-containing protein [Sphingomonadales bacterium]
MKLRILTPIVGLVFGLGLFPTNGLAADEISEEATGILRSMSNYLGSLESFSYDYDVDTEVILNTGEKLQISSSGDAKIRRPDGFLFVRHGGFESGELYFDGKFTTLYGKSQNIFYQIENVGTIDDAIDNLRYELGVDAAGADLMYANPYEILMEGVESGEYIGKGVVGGVEGHHLAFRQEEVDWQIWIQTGETPVPIKYIITTKWMTGAPQYSIRLRNWNVNLDFGGETFQFTPPAGATEAEDFFINEVGEITVGE